MKTTEYCLFGLLIPVILANYSVLTHWLSRMDITKVIFNIVMYYVMVIGYDVCRTVKLVQRYKS